MDAPTSLRRRGGIAPRSCLVEDGVSPTAVRTATAAGAIVLVRRGWYALPSADPEAVSAVRVGGALTAVSAAKLHGLWTLDDGLLHVSVPRNAARLRTAQAVCIHWRREAGPTATAMDSVEDALLYALGCQSEEAAIVLIDSALNQGLVTRAALEERFRGRPARYRRALRRSDGRAESGTETLVRLRLRALGLRVRIQVPFGRYRVDVLVGDRLVIECHSRAHHTGVEAYARDRRREIALVGEGLRPLTVSYEQILFEWAEVERVILGLVGRREHVWPRRRRRVSPTQDVPP